MDKFIKFPVSLKDIPAVVGFAVLVLGVYVVAKKTGVASKIGA